MYYIFSCVTVGRIDSLSGKEIFMLQTDKSKSDGTVISKLENYPDVLTAEQLSEILQISTKTCYTLLRDGYIEYKKIGRAYKIFKTNLIKFLENSH